MSVQVVNVGSINIDHVYQVPNIVRSGETLPSESVAMGLGGKGANQSVALARAGVEVAHVGQVSKTDQWALNQLTGSCVNVESIHLIDGVSGHAIIQVDADGENAIVLHGGANQSLDVNLVTAALAEYSSAQYWVLQNECNLLAELFDLARDNDIKLVLNPAPMTQRVTQLPLSELDTLIVNQGEAEALTGLSELEAIIEYCHQQWPSVRVIITLGGQGAVLVCREQLIWVKADIVNAVDTTGAGDTFVGYFVAALVEGLSEEAALRLATKAAAITVTRAGAIAAIPLRKELS